MVIQFTTVTDNAQINGIEVLQPKPLVPVGLSAAANSAQVALTWQPCAGAASYNIYRSATSGGPYTLIVTAGSVTEISYSDYTASQGTTWYYVITAVNSYGESGKSSEVSAALICTPPPAPTAGNNGPIYQGMTLNLTASAVASATYSWTGPNGSPRRSKTLRLPMLRPPGPGRIA
jgi:fibronectin type 3 domain-containing protein